MQARALQAQARVMQALLVGAQDMPEQRPPMLRNAPTSLNLPAVILERRMLFYNLAWV